MFIKKRHHNRSAILSPSSYEDYINFTRVSPILVSRNYPPSFWTDFSLRMYLHFANWCNYERGYCYHGRKSFINRVRWISPEAYLSTLDSLVDCGLLRCHNVNRWRKNTFLLIPPIRCSNGHLINRGTSITVAMEHRNLHFIKIPKELLIELLAQDDLTDRDLLVLLKVMRFWQPKIFKGVDPNAIRIVNDGFIIHPSLYYDLYLTENEFVESLEELLYGRFLHIEPTRFTSEIIDCHQRLRIVESPPSFLQRIRELSGR